METKAGRQVSTVQPIIFSAPLPWNLNFSMNAPATPLRLPVKALPPCLVNGSPVFRGVKAATFFHRLFYGCHSTKRRLFRPASLPFTTGGFLFGFRFRARLTSGATKARGLRRQRVTRLNETGNARPARASPKRGRPAWRGPRQSYPPRLPGGAFRLLPPLLSRLSAARGWKRLF